MSIQEQLAGTVWELDVYQSEDKFGNINYPLGEDATGIIIFTSDNRLAVQIMSGEGEKDLTKEELEAYNTETEKKMARFGYHSYSGPITIDEEKGHVTTHVEISLVSDYVGSKQTRAAKIEGDTLYLSNVEHPERKIVWKKIEN